jgi:hypothetical protein
MNAPRRLLDPGSDAGAALRALLAAASPPGGLPRETRECVRRRLQASVDRAVCERLRAPSGGLFFACAAAALLWGARLDWVVEPMLLAGGERVAAAAERPSTAPVVPAAPRSPPAVAVGLVVAPALPADARTQPAPPPERVIAHAPSPGERTRQSALRERWREQRWAREAERSRGRIAALVDEILKPEARLLQQAEDQVGGDPDRALALIDAYRARHPGAEVPAPSVVVEVDALRRLGRFDEALARARVFVEASGKRYYADEMRDRFALLEL